MPNILIPKQVGLVFQTSQTNFLNTLSLIPKQSGIFVSAFLDKISEHMVIALIRTFDNACSESVDKICVISG